MSAPGLPRLLATGLAAAAFVVAGCTGARPHPGIATAPRMTAHRTATPETRAPGKPGPATWLASDGVHAVRVEEENARAGDPGWVIPAHARTGIAGFAGAVYAARGEHVVLYVSTRAASFRVEAYRMGYYHGAGARLVWRSPPVPGRIQPGCPRSAGTNMVACDNWTRSTTLTVSAAFVPGDYLLKLVGSGGQQSYIPLTVWDPASHATYLVKNDLLTWQAWNDYGGYDLYAGVGTCPPGIYPLCSRARVLSFDRPYRPGRGAGDFLGLELPLVRFVEQHGLDVTYATDLTLIEHPRAVLAHKALLSLGHDECWDLHERRTAILAERHGINIAFLGASGMLRHVRLQRSPLGADREIVDYRDSSADPLNEHGDPLEVTGNTWGSPPASWPATQFVGARYVGYLRPGTPSAPFVVAEPRSWIFAGLTVRMAAAIPEVIASDVDAFDPASHPTNLEIFGHSPIPVEGSQVNDQFGSIYYSDMTYYTDPTSHAGVFDAGTNNWIPALTPCPTARPCPAWFVQRVTSNLLDILGRGPAGRWHPSRPDWQSLYPQ